MQKFQVIFEIRKRSFISALSICKAVPLRKNETKLCLTEYLRLILNYHLIILKQYLLH